MGQDLDNDNQVETVVMNKHHIFQEEPTKEKTFFCIRLVGYIMRDGCSYEDVFNKARDGECPYKDECEIYKRTIEKRGRQLRWTNQ